MPLKKHTPTVIGVTLIILYCIQQIFVIKWNFLENLQNIETYKRWSGLIVGLLIVFQWLLTFSRIIPKFRKRSHSINNIHKNIGLFSPIFLYIHSTNFGFGYLALFTYLYILNMILGTLNLDIIKTSKDWVFKGWMITHVALSMIITLLLFFHIGMVFYFK